MKSEIKLEDRINGMDIQEESDDKLRARLKYPESMGEFLDRTEPQLFLMQVKCNLNNVVEGQHVNALLIF